MTFEQLFIILFLLWVMIALIDEFIVRTTKRKKTKKQKHNTIKFNDRDLYEIQVSELPEGFIHDYYNVCNTNRLYLDCEGNIYEFYEFRPGCVKIYCIYHSWDEFINTFNR